MDFNEANNILKRIKREYRAFEDLGDLIQYCIELEGSKASHLAELAELKKLTDKAKADYDIHKDRLVRIKAEMFASQKTLVERLAEADNQIKNKKEAVEARMLVEEDKADARKQDLDALIKAKEVAYIHICQKVDEVTKQHEAAVAKYNEFKRNL
jgi:hypothetical protein